MQQTYYSVMVEVQPGHWIEQIPRPRSKHHALEVGETCAAAGKQVKVIRYLQKRDVVTTWNRTPRV